MTDIDLKRLAVDRGYWDSLAPEGATHYCPARKDWLNCYAVSVDYCCIHRPPKKAHDGEWQDGLPPVGEKVEFRRKAGVSHGQWSKGTPEAIKRMNDNPSYCIWMMEHTDSGNGFCWQTIWAHEYEFRPLKTDAERELDELAHLIDENYGNSGAGIADAILAAGWQKPE